MVPGRILPLQGYRLQGSRRAAAREVTGIRGSSSQIGTENHVMKVIDQDVGPGYRGCAQGLTIGMLKFPLPGAD